MTHSSQIDCEISACEHAFVQEQPALSAARETDRWESFLLLLFTARGTAGRAMGVGGVGGGRQGWLWWELP